MESGKIIQQWGCVLFKWVGVGSMGEANRKPLKASNENSPQNFTNIDIHVSMEVLIKPQIFTNKKK